MNGKFAAWYEISQINAEHEQLNRRWQAVEKIAENLEPASVYRLAKAYHGLAAEAPNELIDAIREFDSAFVASGRETEISVIAAAVLNEVLDSDPDRTSDLAALAVVVPGLQGLRKKSPIPELISSANQYLATRSAELRKPARETHSDAVVAKENIDGAIQALKDNQPPQAADHLNAVITAQSKIMRGQAAEIKSLEKRLLLLREESDILWWLTGMHSRTLDRSFSDLDIGCAALLGGRELADLTHIIPGPLSIGAFAKKMLFGAFEKSAATDIGLATAINAMPAEVRKEWGEAAEGLTGIDICPLHSGIIHSLSVAKPSEWASVFKKSQQIDAKVKCAPVALSRQMYLETLLLRAGV